MPGCDKGLGRVFYVIDPDTHENLQVASDQNRTPELEPGKASASGQRVSA
jgi:hypothetical protein